MLRRSIELKWAMVFFVMSLLWMALERVVGLHDTFIGMHPIFTNLNAQRLIGA